jgi:hypothetical protein
MSTRLFVGLVSSLLVSPTLVIMVFLLLLATVPVMSIVPEVVTPCHLTLVLATLLLNQLHLLLPAFIF